MQLNGNVEALRPVDLAPVEDSNASPAHGPSTQYQHLQPLWERFHATRPGDPARAELREQLVLGYRPVVENIASRYSRSIRESAADLIQVGMVGLIKAIDNVAPDRISEDVLTYLIPCVRGEIKRHFRDRTWTMRTPRRLKDLSVAIDRQTPALTQRFGRAPRPSELATALGADLGEVIDALNAQLDQHPGSIDIDRTGTEQALADVLGSPDPAYDKIENREVLRPLIQALPQRERTILTLRFFGDMTQSQIGEHVGISQMHVSRLLAQTLSGLRSALAPIENTDDTDPSTPPGSASTPLTSHATTSR